MCFCFKGNVLLPYNSLGIHVVVAKDLPVKVISNLGGETVGLKKGLIYSNFTGSVKMNLGHCLVPPEIWDWAADAAFPRPDEQIYLRSESVGVTLTGDHSVCVAVILISIH